MLQVKTSIFIFIGILASCQSVSDYNKSKSYEYSIIFLIYAIECAIGVVLNSCVLCATIPSKSSDHSFYTFSIALSLSNLLVSVDLFVRNAISVKTRHVTSYPFGPPCFVGTLVEIFNVLLNASLIVTLSFIAKLYLSDGTKVSVMRLYILMSIGAICSFSLAIVVVLAAHGGYAVDSSETYCAYQSDCIICHVCLYSYVALLLTFLCHNAYHVHKALLASQQLLEGVGIRGQAKGQYLFMAKTLGVFTLSLLGTESLFIGGKLYELFSGQAVNIIVATFMACTLISGPLIIFPTLFILRNYDVKDRLVNTIKYITSFVRCKREDQVYADIPSLNRDLEEGNLFDYNNWEYWMKDSALREIIYEDAKRQLASENIHFFEDVCNYRYQFIEFLSRFRSIRGEQDDRLKHDWAQLNNLANKLYVVYIKVSCCMQELITVNLISISTYLQAPTAPLEVNIDSKTRSNIEEVLLKSMAEKVDKNSNREAIFTFAPLPSENSCMIENYMRVFDKAMDIIKDTIETDVWPRFKKTQSYRETIQRHGKCKRLQVK